MKKYILIIMSLLLPVLLTAQARLETKKFKISEIAEHTMEIVPTGDPFLDAVLRDELPSIWSLSPCEFCTLEQFEERKTSEDYYFLCKTDSFFGDEKEPGISSLTLFKGSSKAGEGTDGMYRVATIPFCGKGREGGMEAAFLPALANILQQYVRHILSREFNLGDMVRVTDYTGARNRGKMVLISEDDMAEPSAVLPDGNIILAQEEEVEEALRNRDPRYMVGYAVFPDEPVRGSACFVMMIDAESHELRYFRQRNASTTGANGFTRSDIITFQTHVRK